MKRCFKCGAEKPLEEFYVHKEMADGRIGKCKECAKKDCAERYNTLIKDPAFLQSERKRARLRNIRLNYKDKYKLTTEQKSKYNKRSKEKYLEKYAARIKSQRSGIKIKGFHNHHWSYSIENAKDTILIAIKDHYKVHRYMKYDQDKKIYITMFGEILDTKEKHISFIEYVISLPD